MSNITENREMRHAILDEVSILSGKQPLDEEASFPLAERMNHGADDHRHPDVSNSEQPSKAPLIPPPAGGGSTSPESHRLASSLPEFNTPPSKQSTVFDPNQEIRKPNNRFFRQRQQHRKPRSKLAVKHYRLVRTIFFQTALLLAAIVAIIWLAVALRQSKKNKVTNERNAPGRPDQQTNTTLANIRARGYLNCGVVEHPGLSMFDNAARRWSGFEVDLCRAVGASIFGEDGHVQFAPLTNGERFTVLQSKQVDLLAAGVTYTMERDLHEPTAKAGFAFSTPYFYNGMSFAGLPEYVYCAESFNTTGNCSGLVICLQDNTTHVQVVESFFPDSFAGVIKLAPTLIDFYRNFKQGYCNVLAGEQFDLAGNIVRQAGYKGDYSISNKVFSKEPIAIVTRDDDVEWSDYVNWVFLALLTAENRTISQEAAQDAVVHPAPSVDVSQIGFYRAVATVGNYAEMYSRNLEPLVPRVRVNQQNKANTPLIYSFPLGNHDAIGAGPVAGGTLERILQRGELVCGVGGNPFFAKFSAVGQQWSGLDVLICKVISAAIFNGTGSTRVVKVDPDERFVALESDSIDILVRITGISYPRDVNETSTNLGFTFSPPYYYGGLQFGGIPPYGNCADRQETLGNNCSNLRICVSNGTANMLNTLKHFTKATVILKPNEEEVYRCLDAGEANAIGIFDTAVATVRQYYTGPYQRGRNMFSRSNLAPVTKEDDVQWSSFVTWIMHALFYAEEQGITQATYQDMPLVNLFGPLFTNMFQHAIQAFGSYGEIYNASAKAQYPRPVINTVNALPYGPQHYPPPGLFGLY